MNRKQIKSIVRTSLSTHKRLHFKLYGHTRKDANVLSSTFNAYRLSRKKMKDRIVSWLEATFQIKETFPSPRKPNRQLFCMNHWFKFLRRRKADIFPERWRLANWGASFNVIIFYKLKKREISILFNTSCLFNPWYLL